MTACPHCSEQLPPKIQEFKPIQLVACSECMNACLVEWLPAGPLAKPLDGMEPVRELAPPGSVMEGVFSMLREAIAELPVLPEVPQRIASMINDPIVSMSDLAGVINQDAAISLKVMRMANSAFYASPHEITELQTACSRMGLKTLGHVVQTAANANLYKTSDKAFKDVVEGLWRHGAAAAHCADEIASKTPSVPRSLPFSAGLVHDIGKLVLIDIITVKYKGGTGRLRESPDLLLKVIDRFQSLVGLHVVQYWDMSPEHLFTTYFCPQPQSIPVEQWEALTHVVTLASDAADACGFSIAPMEAELSIADHPSTEALGLNDEQIDSLQLSLPESLEGFMGALGGP